MGPLLIRVWPDMGSALGLGRSTCYQLVSDGHIASVRVGKRRLVAVAEVERFAAGLLNGTIDGTLIVQSDQAPRHIDG